MSRVQKVGEPDPPLSRQGFDPDTYVSALVRQSNVVEPVQTTDCAASYVSCSQDHKVFDVSICPHNTSQYSYICTRPDPRICEIKNGEEVLMGMDATAEWDSGRAANDLVVRCKYPITEFLVKEVEIDGKLQADYDLSAQKIRFFNDQYATGDFGNENINSMSNTLFPVMCFSQTTTCPFDYTNIDTEHPSGQQMDRCSNVNSTSDLGGMCATWYKSSYSPAMESRIARYAEEHKGLNNDDLRCVNRHESPEYNQLAQSLGVSFNPGCYWAACVPGSPQLKPSEHILHPTCAENVCLSVVNILNNSDSYTNTTYNIVQNTTCGAVAATDVELAEFDSSAFLNSLILAIVICGLALIVFLICVIIV